jgi:hypothetical protein
MLILGILVVQMTEIKADRPLAMNTAFVPSGDVVALTIDVFMQEIRVSCG